MMNKNVFKNKSEELIAKNDIKILLQVFLKEKLTQLESKQLSIPINSKLGELQNSLASITARYNRFKTQELKGVLNNEEINLQSNKLIANCILLKDEILDVSEFFNEDLPNIEDDKTKPVLKNDFKSVEELFNKIEESYNKKIRNIDSINTLFLTILPENKSYQTGDIFESLIEQQRIVKKKDSFYFSNTNLKCSKNIKNENRDDFFIPIVCVLNSMCLPKSMHLLRFLNYVKFYGIRTVFCIIYEDDEKTCEPIISLLKENNIIVETLGGLYQVQEVSLTTKSGFQELIEKIFFECELLGLN